MHFWWANQNQTFRQELAGGYLWSPKREANGARNPFYKVTLLRYFVPSFWTPESSHGILLFLARVRENVCVAESHGSECSPCPST